jgi:hypothetical protein
MGLADIEFRIYEHGVMHAGALEHRELCQAMMNRIVAVFNRICKRRRTKVMSMQEFYPRSAVLHGLNHNHGALIEIRFRAPENKNSVLEFPHIVKTAAHELAHNWIGAHNASFWKLYDEILAEAEQVLDDMTSAGIAEQRRRGVNVMDMNSLGMTGGGSPNGFDDRKYGGELTLGEGGASGSDSKGAPGGADGAAGAAFAGTGHVVGGVGNTVGTAGKAAIAAMPGKGNRLGGGGGDDTEAVIRAARLARLGGPAAQQQGPTADEEMRRLRLRGWLRRLGLEERDAVVREQQRRREQMLLAARGRNGNGDAVTLTAQEEADIEEYHPTCGVRHGEAGGNEDGDGCCGGDAAPQRAKIEDNAGAELAPPPPRPPAPEQQQQQQERPRQEPPPPRSKAMSSASAAAAAAAEGRRQRQREEQAAMNPPEDAKHCECLGASAGWHKPDCPLK